MENSSQPYASCFRITSCICNLIYSSSSSRLSAFFLFPIISVPHRILLCFCAEWNLQTLPCNHYFKVLYLSGFFLAVLQHSREMLELLILFCFSNVWALYSLSLIHGKRPNLKFTCWCVSWCQLFSFSDWLGQMWTVALFFSCPDISLSWVPNKKKKPKSEPRNK